MGFLERLKRQRGQTRAMPTAPRGPSSPGVDDPVVEPAVHPESWNWREPLPAGVVPVGRLPGGHGSSSRCLLDPETLEPLRYLEESDEVRLGVLLFTVAGTGYRLNDARSPEFESGRRVRLVPEPTNKYDRNAVAVRSLTSDRAAGYVPAPKSGARDFQREVHHLLAQGPVEAMVLEWEEVDGDARPWLAIRVVATSRRFLEVDRPWDGDELKELRSSALELEGRRWPDERARLRRAVEAASGVSDRHFALQELIQRAYRLRDAHPEALGDAIEACREQISLSKEVGQAMESSYGSKPTHYGFKQLAIILEKQKRFAEATEVVEEAQRQAWDGDWQNRLERLRRRQERS